MAGRAASAMAIEAMRTMFIGFSELHGAQDVTLRVQNSRHWFLIPMANGLSREVLERDARHRLPRLRGRTLGRSRMMVTRPGSSTSSAASSTSNHTPRRSPFSFQSISWLVTSKMKTFTLQ